MPRSPVNSGSSIGGRGSASAAGSYTWPCADRRARAVEDEHPFFALHFSMMASEGVTLYEAVKRLIGRCIYRRLENDAVYLVRSFEFMGVDQMSTLERLARPHRPALRDFLYGYSFEPRSGDTRPTRIASSRHKRLNLIIRSAHLLLCAQNSWISRSRPSA